MSYWLKRFRFLSAVATLIGMIVGVGIFGIPYVVAQAGFAVGFFYLALLGLAVLAIHLFYGEIVLRTEQPHRLVGYAAKYLGRRAKKIATFVVLLEYYGALLAYIIVGGQFLAIIFGHWLSISEFAWALLFFAAGTWAVFSGIKTVAKSELFMTGLLLLTVAVLLAKGGFLVDFENLKASNLAKFFLPYGVILFALAGSAAIPEMRQILKGEEQYLKKAIYWGTFIPILLYCFFALVVVGISGSQTSQEAIKGLIPFLGKEVIILGAFFGVLAVFTSFLILGLNLKRVFQYDWRLKSFWSSVLACFIPLSAYLLGLKSFIFIIGFAGAVAGGLDSILMILIYLRAKKIGDRQPEYSLGWFRSAGYLLLILFGLGVIYQFVYLAL